MRYASIVAVMIVMIGVHAVAADKRTNVPIGDSPSLGPANAPVTIIEFIDFQ